MKLILNSVSVKRMIKALDKYVELSEEKIQESERLAKEKGFLYNGDIIRFNDSYITDIVKVIKKQMED